MLFISDLLGTLRSTYRIAKATLDSSDLTAARVHTLPDASGTIALTSSWPVSMAVDDVSGLTYSFVAGDLGRAKRFTNAAGCTVTIPTGLGTGWTAVWERSSTAGSITFDGNATLVASNGSGSLVASVGRAGAIVSEATDTYQITGQLGVAAGGGALTVTSTTVTVSPAEFYTCVEPVTDAAALITSKVMCWLEPNSDWDADDLAEFELFATPRAGAIDFTIGRTGPIVGSFTINYVLG